MKRNEKQLVILAGVLFAVVLVFRVVPLVMDYYSEGQNEIARLENRIDNFRNLLEETGRLAELEQSRREEVEALGDWVFHGSNVNFILTRVQSELRKAADTAGVTVRETGLPAYSVTGDWLVVNQEISFLLARQEDILGFLNLLERSRPRLFVTEFSISRSRRQYTGSLVVTGFGKAQPAEVTASGQR